MHSVVYLWLVRILAKVEEYRSLNCDLGFQNHFAGTHRHPRFFILD